MLQNHESKHIQAVADPGFPVGGAGPATWVLFGKNVCKNERIGSHMGACARHARPPDPPMTSHIHYTRNLVLEVKLNQKCIHGFPILVWPPKSIEKFPNKSKM